MDGVVDILVSALPAWAVAGIPIAFLAGGVYLLQHFKLLQNPFKEDDWDDDNW